MPYQDRQTERVLGKSERPPCETRFTGRQVRSRVYGAGCYTEIYAEILQRHELPSNEVLRPAQQLVDYDQKPPLCHTLAMDANFCDDTLLSRHSIR